MLSIEIAFDDLLKLVDQLTDEQKRILSDHIATNNPLTEKKPRVLGLHPGAFQPSDDFDETLPDEFWLGEDS